MLVVAGLVVIGRRRQPQDLLLLTAIVLVYFIISRSNTRLTSYLVPIIPLFVLCAAEALRAGWESKRLWIRAVAAGVLLSQTGYAIAFSELYRGSDPREQAGHWLISHIPPGEEVGVIRRYWWTPGILRQTNSPYKVISPCDDQTGLQDCVLAMDQMPPVPWLVTSDAEVREFIHRTPPVHPSHDKVLKEFLSHYQPVIAFEKKPRWAGVSLWGRWTTFDFLYIAPTVTVWSRREPHLPNRTK